MDPAAGEQVVVIGLVVGGASLLLLAGACLNVGSLLLSRAVARRRDRDQDGARSDAQGARA